MRFAMPNHPCDFEIPDDWLAEAGIDDFRRTSLAYRSAAEAILVPIVFIEPPPREAAIGKDWRGFDRQRLVSVLRGIESKAEIEPVPLLELSAGTSIFPHPYRYRVCDGFHRFYASIVAGFECVPGTML